MTAINKSLAVEARGKAIIYDWLDLIGIDYADIYSGFDGDVERIMQKHGDVILFRSNGRMDWVDFKVEEENKFGNFFIETLSNKNVTDVCSHYERASTPGWLYSSRAAYIFYYFVKSDELYTIRLFELKRFLLSHDIVGSGHPVLDKYPEKPQGKYIQLNDTWGRTVPIVDVCNALQSNCRLIHPNAALNERKEQERAICGVGGLE